MDKMQMLLLLVVIISFLTSCGGAAEIPPQMSPPPEAVARENISAAESHGGQVNSESNSQANSSTITLTIGDTEVTAELDDSEIARQFIALLPQTINMSRGRDREYYGGIDGTLDYDEGIFKPLPRMATWRTGLMATLWHFSLIQRMIPT